jgi:hypothetical protein
MAILLQRRILQQDLYVLLNIFEVIKNSKDVQALCFGLHTLLDLNTYLLF